MRRAIVCRLSLVAALFGTCLAGVGCGRNNPGAPTYPSPQPAPVSAQPAINAVKPERRTVQRGIAQPGRIEAFQQTPVFARIAGFVQEVRADIGDVVESGQTIAVLSVPELDEELAQKEALVTQARAEVERAQKSLEAATASTRNADALVERRKTAVDRLEKLAKGKGAVEPQTLDDARYLLEVARTGREESAALRERAQADVRVNQAKLEVAQAGRRRLSALVDFAEIKAPFDGIVTRRNVDKGHLVQPAQGGAKAEPLFVVMQTDPVRVFVDVPELDAVWVADGTPARIRVQALPGREFEGKVTRSAWALDPRARTLRTEIDVDNPRAELRPGMYAYATIVVEHAKTWTLPASAVLSQADQTYCYRIENGKAVRTPLETGLREASIVEVLRKQTKAAKAGEKPVWEEFTGREEIVQNPPANLTDGQPISVTPATK
ncbi:MAG: efflux RND transporter periplasmic adaptor subunit [Gemmataceae bacterium]|nr:efflux RND transporter periplasmic adaptor subunit [Gemmataceae bacterium]